MQLHPRRAATDMVMKLSALRWASWRVAHLARDCDLIQVLILHGPFGFVGVVEHDGHSGLCHSRLPLLVYKLLQAVCTHLAQHSAQGLRQEDKRLLIPRHCLKDGFPKCICLRSCFVTTLSTHMSRFIDIMFSLVAS
jgi:hypothetical protein